MYIVGILVGAMNPTLRTAARTRAALDLASSRALLRGDLPLAAELASARCEAWFAARAMGLDANALEYLSTRLVRVSEALERQRVRFAVPANDVARVAA